MPKSREAKIETGSLILCGSFSKKEAAGQIAAGCRHVHSSALGERDPLYVVTRSWDLSKPAPTFTWETKSGSQQGNRVLQLTTSTDRHLVIDRLIKEPAIASKRHLKDSVATVLEELLTNAIYHAYRNPDGGEKYSRTRNVKLSAKEAVELSYRIEEAGAYLEVRDNGGNLSFHDVASSFARCYGESNAQIQEKQGGAGLGVYMIFEMVSHLKVVSENGRSTRIGCWMADKKSFDPGTFSFNFF